MFNQPGSRVIPQEWLEIAKAQLKISTKVRLYHRFDKLENVINRVLKSQSTLPSFIVDDSLKQEICQQVLNEIDQYQGYKINEQKFPKSVHDVIVKTRTWWNRLGQCSLLHCHL